MKSKFARYRIRNPQSSRRVITLCGGCHSKIIEWAHVGFFGPAGDDDECYFCGQREQDKAEQADEEDDALCEECDEPKEDGHAECPFCGTEY